MCLQSNTQSLLNQTTKTRFHISVRAAALRLNASITGEVSLEINASITGYESRKQFSIGLTVEQISQYIGWQLAQREAVP